MTHAKHGQVFPVIVGWGDAKDWLSNLLHLSHGMLHVHIGMTVFLLSSLVFRKPIGSWVPLLIVIGLELLNETSDFLRYQMAGWPWKPGPTIADFFATWLWPVVLTLIFRHHLRATVTVAEPPLEEVARHPETLASVATPVP